MMGMYDYDPNTKSRKGCAPNESVVIISLDGSNSLTIMKIAVDTSIIKYKLINNIVTTVAVIDIFIVDIIIIIC